MVYASSDVGSTGSGVWLKCAMTCVFLMNTNMLLAGLVSLQSVLEDGLRKMATMSSCIEPYDSSSRLSRICVFVKAFLNVNFTFQQSANYFKTVIKMFRGVFFLLMLVIFGSILTVT